MVPVVGPRSDRSQPSARPAWRPYRPALVPSTTAPPPSHVARAASGSDSSSGLRNPDGSDTVFGFQCNERYLDWDESAARQLLRIHVAEQLGTDIEHVNRRLGELAAVCPDLVTKFDRLKASLVLSMVRNVEAVAERMIALSAALPGVNVSAMVSADLNLLNAPPPEALAAQFETLRRELPGVAVERLVEEEPRLLGADIGAVKAELRRLMPGADPVALVATHAGMVLPMKDAGMPASLLIDDGIEAA